MKVGITAFGSPKRYKILDGISEFVVEAFSKEVMCLIFVSLAKFRKKLEKKDAGNTDKMTADWNVLQSRR